MWYIIHSLFRLILINDDHVRKNRLVDKILKWFIIISIKRNKKGHINLLLLSDIIKISNAITKYKGLLHRIISTVVLSNIIQCLIRISKTNIRLQIAVLWVFDNIYIDKKTNQHAFFLYVFKWTKTYLKRRNNHIWILSSIVKSIELVKVFCFIRLLNYWYYVIFICLKHVKDRQLSTYKRD